MMARTGGPAFTTYGGLTIRDWFAGQAIAGMLGSERALDDAADLSRTTGDGVDVILARAAYAAADAMLKVR